MTSLISAKADKKKLPMKKIMLTLMTASFVIALSFNANSQCTPKSTHAIQIAYQDDIVDIALGSKDHTTLVAALKAADLVATLKSSGPFTVFAPVNSAFDKLPEGTVASLLKPENKATLSKILTYHVIAGNLDANAVIGAIKKSNGTLKVETVSGGILQAMIVDGKVVLKDENGNKSTVIATDLKGSNGVIHVIDTVVLPK